MAGVEKIIEKMNRQPHDVRFEEISKVLKHFGYIEVRSDGSHHHFRNKSGDVVTIKKSQPVRLIRQGRAQKDRKITFVAANPCGAMEKRISIIT